jgi:glycosyltransferase involved in cell wall biosynthesis
MACAAPVVAFTDTGPAGIIDHQMNGYLAQHSDAEDLANGIEWILDNDNRRKSLSKNARQKVLVNYDIKMVAEQYAQLYNSLK